MNSFIRKSASKLSLFFACALFVVTAFSGALGITVNARRINDNTIQVDLFPGEEYSFGNELVSRFDKSFFIQLFLLNYGECMENSRISDGNMHKSTMYFSKVPYQAIVANIDTSNKQYTAVVKADDNCTGKCKVVLNKKNIEEQYHKNNPSKTKEECEKYALDSMKNFEKYLDGKENGDGSSEYNYIFLFSEPESVKRTITLDLRDGNTITGIGANSEAYAYDYILRDIGLYFGSHEYNYDSESHTEICTLSNDPKQIVHVQETRNYSITIKADDGCTGEYKIVLNKETLAKAYADQKSDSNYENYIDFGKNQINRYEHYLGDLYRGQGLSEYTVVIKFGTTPVEEPEPSPEPQPQDNPAETPAQETAHQEAVASQVQEEAPKYVPGTKFELKGLKYEIIDAAGNVKFTGVKSKNVKTISVPATVKYNDVSLPVTTVGKNAIKGLNKLTKVTLGTNITTLHKKSIYSCKKLKTLKINSTKLSSVAKNAVGKNAKGFKISVKKSVKKGIKALFKKAGMGKLSIK